VDPFLALADPNRRLMLELLAERSHTAGEIVSHFEISAPAVSQHLKALREAGLVEVEVRKQQRIYTIRSEGFRPVDSWLARNARLWTNRLDRLTAAIAADQAAPRNQSKPPSPEPSRPRKSKSQAKHEPRATKHEPRSRRKP
jgi:DNA-binding transcriptional ArsR family regulator